MGFKNLFKDYQKTIQPPKYECCGVNWLAESEHRKQILNNSKESKKQLQANIT